MQWLISFVPDRSQFSTFVVDATRAQVDQWLTAAVDNPDEILSIPDARIHSCGPASTASLRAGRITDIRPV